MDNEETNTTDTLSFSERYDRAGDNLRAIKGIAYVMAANEAQEEAEIDAASHLGTLARDALDELEAMWERVHAEYERKPTYDAEWTGATADAEMRALAPRILALPEYAVKTVMDFALNVVTAQRAGDEPNQVTLDEIESMLKRGVSLESICAFWHLKRQGVAAMVPAADETHEPQ